MGVLLSTSEQVTRGEQRCTPGYYASGMKLFVAFLKPPKLLKVLGFITVQSPQLLDIVPRVIMPQHSIQSKGESYESIITHKSLNLQ